MQSGTMRYDPETDRWQFYGPSQFSFHCGDPLQVRIGDRYVAVRLEYAEDWYVILHETSFILRRTKIYQVKA